MQQGKGLIKFFLVVMTLVCIMQYFFLYPTSKVEKQAEEYAQSIADMKSDADKSEAFKTARTAYLDSMSSEEIFNIPMLKSFTYSELKARQLALGLDLKGGMSVVLQVDLREFIKALAKDNQDKTFLNALDQATAAQASAQADYVTLFAREFAKTKENVSLAEIFGNNAVLEEDINIETTDDEVIRLIREKANETVDQTFRRLKERIDKLGVTQPNVSLDAGRDLIIVELPGIDNPERAREFLEATAKLEFWNTYRISDQGITQGFLAANETLKKINNYKGAEEEKIIQSIDTVFAVDANGNNDPNTIERIDTTYAPSTLLAQSGPLFDVFQMNGSVSTGAFSPVVLGQADKNQIKTISKMLADPQVKSLFPQDLIFLWSRKPAQDPVTNEYTKKYELYGMKKTPGTDSAPLEGDRVVRASADPDPQSGEVQVSLRMDQAGARTWGRLTTEAANAGNREFAIVLDDEVVSAPRVNEPILGGNSQITGNFTLQEGTDLANILQVGKLPADIRIIQESVVGPSLGAENISRSINSLLIGFALVILFMIAYYGTGGVVSILALFMNIFFIIGALASFGTVLTLPGMAGIILTIGMAVDANVIIYERIREELREGKSMMNAIKDGFGQSYSAIIDANVTTILTAFVLFYFGLGPIKGFATVLIIGVISSLFTAVLVGRMMIDWWTSKDRPISFWTGFSKNAFANVTIDWLGKRKIAYGISLAIIALGIGSYVMRGFELGVDFKGGYSYNVEFDNSQSISADQVRTALLSSFDNAPTIVKAVDTDNTFNITTSYLIDDSSKDAANNVMAALHKGINSVAGGSVALDNFKKADGTGTHVISSSKVGATIADDIKNSSVKAAVFALLLIFLYIFIRFNKWQYSLGAVAALFHDVLVVLSLFTIFHGILPFAMEIDQAFIAAILTVIGYSINDTVVVFDRIREFMGVYSGKSKEEIINMAVNSTISRTIITSLTTLFVIAILLFFGGASMRGFAFALFMGVLVGTYSSVFVATPIMSDFTGEIKAKETKKKSFSRAAAK